MLLPQISVFRVAIHISPHEWGERMDLQSLTTGDVEQATRQRRANAMSFQRLRDFGMQDGKHAITAPIVGERDLSIGIKLEPVPLGVVANGIGHGS